MSVNIFHKSTGDLIQIAGNAMVGGGGSSTPTSSSVIFRNKDEFPTAGDAKILYVATDENIIYRWNGTLNAYVQLDDTTNINEIVGNI